MQSHYWESPVHWRAFLAEREIEIPYLGSCKGKLHLAAWLKYFFIAYIQRFKIILINSSLNTEGKGRGNEMPLNTKSPFDAN